MSEKKEKGVQNNVLTHPQIGEMIYDYDDVWRPAFSAVLKVPLWGKIFEVVPKFMAKDAEQRINSSQEESYARFERLIIEQNVVIEEMISKYCVVSEEEAAVMFVPTEVYFGRRGECLLAFQDTKNEYNDDDFPGFVMFVSPQKLIFENSDDAVFNLHKCVETEDVSRYIQQHGHDPVFIDQPWNQARLEINFKEIDETEREKRKKQFQIEYEQELLKYEQEKAEKNEGEKTEFDNIEMPNSPIRGTIIGIFLFAVLWAGEIGLAFGARQYWSLVAFGLPLLGVTIGGIGACQEYWSDYRLAKRNFMAYRVKMWAKRKKEDDK